MIYDRSYMRNEPPRGSGGSGQSPLLKWILLSTIGVFVVQIILESWFRNQPGIRQAFYEFFTLTPGGIRSGFVWTLLSYAFLHSTKIIFHIIGNMLLVFFIGRELLPLLGPKRFAWLYFGSAAVGGAAWLILHWGGGAVIGASAAAMGLLIVFACLYPNREITLLLFFVIPVRIKPKFVAFALLAFDLFGLVFSEILGMTNTHTAHSAHLGGMLTGWLFYRFAVAGAPAARFNGPGVEMPAWFRNKERLERRVGGYSVNILNRQSLQLEVDRILDKINSEGFGSLSEEEKKLLDQARDILSK